MGLWKKAGSKKGEIVPLWDGCIHFVEILSQCALFSAVGGVGVYNAGEFWRLGRWVWSISPLAAASFFLDAQKEAKEAPGGATGRTSALRPRSPCCLPPGPPFYGGRHLGGMAGRRKGAGGMGIDVASPTAAAAWVGFPAWWFRRLRARLCVRWGTSFSVGRGKW